MDREFNLSENEPPKKGNAGVSAWLAWFVKLISVPLLGLYVVAWYSTVIQMVPEQLRDPAVFALLYYLYAICFAGLMYLTFCLSALPAPGQENTVRGWKRLDPFSRFPITSLVLFVFLFINTAPAIIYTAAHSKHVPSYELNEGTFIMLFLTSIGQVAAPVAGLIAGVIAIVWDVLRNRAGRKTTTRPALSVALNWALLLLFAVPSIIVYGEGNRETRDFWRTILVGTSGSNQEKVDRRFVRELNNGYQPRILSGYIQEGANLNLQGVYGTPLMMAAEAGDLLMVKELLSHGASIGATNKTGFADSGKTALDIALEHNRKEVALFLIDKGGFRSNEQQRAKALIAAVAYIKDKSLVEKLLRPAGSVNASYPMAISGLHGVTSTPLAAATRLGNVEMMRFLLDRGADIDRVGGEMTPLGFAVSERKIEAAKLLLDRGADVNKGGLHNSPPIVFAASHKSPEFLNLLISHGASASFEDDIGRTALSAAATAGDVLRIKRLIRAGAKIDPRGKSGTEALWNSVYSKNPEIVKLFLKLGADPKSRTARGSSVLVEAVTAGDGVMEGDPRIVELLLDAGADPNNGGKQDNPPLVAAAERRNLPVLQLLIRRGADANRQSAFSKRPPIIAAVVGYSDVNADFVSELVRAGADPTLKDRDGKTALDYVSVRTEAGARKAASLLKASTTHP
jgi:ankyrin repeat protein